MPSEPSDEPHGTPTAPTPATAPDSGTFERYALVAALTLVVLCLVAWDRLGGSGAAGAPPPDRTLRVEIGGGAPAQPGRVPQPQPQSGSDPRVRVEPPPPQPPPTPPPPELTYTVKDGDTLSGIAREQLGSARRAAEIAELNGVPDPGRIRPGQVLKLPPR
jgi:nucleoid-associated protein YgaU